MYPTTAYYALKPLRPGRLAYQLLLPSLASGLLDDHPLDPGIRRREGVSCAVRLGYGGQNAG